MPTDVPQSVAASEGVATGRARSSTRRRVVAVVVTVGLAALLALGWVWEGLRSGPLTPPPNATTNGVSVAKGASVTWGGAYLLNDSADAVRLRTVALVGSEGADGARVDRVEVLDPATAPGGVGVGAGDAYEDIPANLRHPIEGYELKPGQYVNILVKVSATGAGVWRFGALDVAYTGSGSRHSVRLPQAFVLCVDIPGDCPIR